MPWGLQQVLLRERVPVRLARRLEQRQVPAQQQALLPSWSKQ